MFNAIYLIVVGVLVVLIAARIIMSFFDLESVKFNKYFDLLLDLTIIVWVIMCAIELVYFKN